MAGMDRAEGKPVDIKLSFPQRNNSHGKNLFMGRSSLAEACEPPPAYGRRANEKE